MVGSAEEKLRMLQRLSSEKYFSDSDIRLANMLLRKLELAMEE